MAVASLAILILLPSAGFSADKGKAGKKQMCITFDDLPALRVQDRIERLMITDQILGTLDEFDVKAAGFVNGGDVEGDLDIIRSWLEAGHEIGNHTWSHQDLNEIPVNLFLPDIEKCQNLIGDLQKEFKQKNKYFRYPLLHYGKTTESRQAVMEYIEENNYIIAHVSIDNDDYIYNLQFEALYDSDETVKYIQLGDEFIDHIMTQIESAEKLADEIVGRPVKHILLLHASRLTAEFLGDLLAQIELAGYEFISLDAALSDPVYRLRESYVGPKGLSYLERLSRTDPDLLPARESK